MENLLEVRDLKTHFSTDHGTIKAVDGASFCIQKGKVLGVVGESGCGKSITSLSILGLIASNGRVVQGEILYHKDGEVIDLAKLKPKGKKIKAIRGKEIALVFQEPMTAFSPVYTIGAQIIEAIRVHNKGMDKEKAQKLAIEMLVKVGMPRPKQRINEYPYQLSGGMRQRALIAMALSCSPNLLIADEPTTALDVTIEAQILQLIRDLHQNLGMSVMLITHDLGVISELADDVVVMYLGRVVESADIDSIFHNPKHPYTKALLRSIPRIEDKKQEELYTLKGAVPDPYAIPSGCPFHPRCPEYMPGVCEENNPTLEILSERHKVSCLLYGSRREEHAKQGDSGG